MPRSTLAAALVAACLLAPVALADHPQSSGARTITFDHKTGNEWWVEVIVKGSAVQGIDARDTGGDWKALTLRSWGAWAGSFHIEAGNLVQFRARFSDGTALLSCEFTHPAGVERCGDAPPPPPPPPPPPTGNFTASFSSVKGNEWWIQASVKASGGTLARVDARLDEGDWKPLTDRGWGWAASYRAPEGTIVQLRAVSTTGAESLSGCYRWVAATSVACGDEPPPPPPPPPPTGNFTAAFTPKPGNEWWVETKVTASKTLAGVDARIVDGDWRALTLRSWGAWAASFHVPDGSHVEFRARATSGESVVSGRYAWPSATPVDDTARVWPREGSYVKVQTETGEAVPGYFRERVTNSTYTYRNGAWSRSYEGWSYSECCDEPGRFAHFKGSDRAAPAVAPTRGLALGDQVEVSGEVGTLVARTERASTRLSAPVAADAWKMQYRPEHPQAVDAWWHSGTGLVLDFENSMSHSWHFFEVKDTDAPIAKGDERSIPPAPSSWPFEASYVRYANVETYAEGRTDATLALAFRDGFWQGVCDVRHEPTTTSPGSSFRVHVARAPLMLPTDVEPGRVLVSDVYHECDRWAGEEVIVRGQFPEDTTMDAAPYRAKVWWGDEHPDGSDDADAWWDAATGLVLRYEDTEHWIRLTGRVSDTDAPLAAW